MALDSTPPVPSPAHAPTPDAPARVQHSPDDFDTSGPSDSREVISSPSPATTSLRESTPTLLPASSSTAVLLPQASNPTTAPLPQHSARCLPEPVSDSDVPRLYPSPRYPKRRRTQPQRLGIENITSPASHK